MGQKVHSVTRPTHARDIRKGDVVEHYGTLWTVASARTNDGVTRVMLHDEPNPHYVMVRRPTDEVLVVRYVAERREGTAAWDGSAAHIGGAPNPDLTDHINALQGMTPDPTKEA